MDHGIEWCENAMLNALEKMESEATSSISADRLEHLLPGATGFEGLRNYMKRERFEEGHRLIGQGDAPRGLYFLEEGQLRIHLELEDGKPGKRLRTMTAGTVVGEIGLFLGVPATASVTVERPSTLYHLPAENLDKMEAESPEIAANLHKFIVRTLSERLARTNETLRALLD
jgi:sulfate permease, SulP family